MASEDVCSGHGATNLKVGLKAMKDWSGRRTASRGEVPTRRRSARSEVLLET